MDTPVSPTVTGTTVGSIPLDILRPSGRKLTGILTIPTTASSSTTTSPQEKKSDVSPTLIASSSTITETTKPLVLLLHGLLSNKDHNFAPVLANTLTESLNVYTYRFDFRTGSSPEEPNFRYRFCGFEEDLDDTECCIQYFTKEGYHIVGIIGHSRGGNIALMYASRYYSSSSSSTLPDDKISSASASSSSSAVTRIQALNPGIIAISPRYQMKGMLEKFLPEQLALLENQNYFDWPAKGTGFSGNIQVTKEDVEYVQTLDMEKIVSSISIGTPLMFLHGGADKTIPSEDSHIAASVAHKETQLQIFSGANHTFQGSKLTTKLITSCTEFLQNCMNVVRKSNSIHSGSSTGKPQDLRSPSKATKTNGKVTLPPVVTSSPVTHSTGETKNIPPKKTKFASNPSSSSSSSMITTVGPITLPALYTQLLNNISPITEDYLALQQAYFKSLVNSI